MRYQVWNETQNAPARVESVCWEHPDFVVIVGSHQLHVTGAATVKDFNAICYPRLLGGHHLAAGQQEKREAAMSDGSHMRKIWWCWIWSIRINDTPAQECLLPL